MNNAINSPDHANHSRVFLMVLGGLVFGIAIGIVSYLTALLVFNSQDSSDKASDSSNNQLHSSDKDVETAISNWIFSEELSQAELLRLSETLGSLNQRELLDLIGKSSSQPWTTRLYTVQEMLIESLVHISPETAVANVEQFDVDRRRTLLLQIFSQWSQMDIESAMATAKTLPRSDQGAILNAILIDQKDLADEELSSVVQRLNLESELNTFEQERELHELLKEEPNEAIRTLANDSVDDYLQIDLFRQVVAKWFQNDGLNIVPALRDIDMSRGVYAELFDQVTRQDRAAALNVFHSVDLNSNESFGFHLMDNWVEDDAKGAFQAVRGLPKSHYRNFLFLRVISAWGLRRPNEVLDHVMDLPRLYRADAVSSAAIVLARDNPLGAIDRISEFRSVPGTNVDSAIESVVRNWADEAPKLAFEWVINNSQEGSKNRHELMSNVLPKYALDEPKRAMSVAVQEFNPEYSGWSLESRIINSLLFENRLDTAIEVVDQVRDEIKVSEYINIGAELVKQERMDDALTLIDSVPEEQRSDYLYAVTSRLTIYDLASDALELIAKAPSSQLQADVAERLLADGAAETDFTAKQIEILKSYARE
ncbi:MAG: hypothetical protein OXH31_03465 [Gammaproteobacteria bacterium]|nr:hypothetical protein [Gammaproteobacteria bacterium]